MHPVLILIPAAAVMLVPRFWVNRVLKQHHRKEEDFPGTGGELAREFLDRYQLHAVKVEKTDIGDHYDPLAKAVRLTRDKFDRKTLTAVTTAAHEVGHALQDASGYGPFVWRTHLAKVAQVTGEVGTVLLLAVPAAALATRNPVPPIVIGTAALAMLGTGFAAQLAALPTEFDASFGRALPLLRDGVIRGKQVNDARKILTACSFTYIASSLAAVLQIWPWLPRGPVRLFALHGTTRRVAVRKETRPRAEISRTRTPHPRGTLEKAVRQVGKPLVKSWLRLSEAF